LALVSFITLGCAKNEVDSNRMQALVLAAGHTLSDDPGAADVVVVNTCSFITEATEEAIDTILAVLGLDNFSKGSAKLVVAGCLPSRYGAAQDGELARELPEVAAFISAADEDGIVEVLERLSEKPDDACPGRALSPRAQRTARGAAPAEALFVPRIADAPWAYIKIADGCSRRCSFCTIPNIRGPYRSRPLGEILAEADALAGQGVRELVLIAQDTGLWQDGPQRLPDLLQALAERHPQVWLRLMYLQPQGVTKNLLTIMAKYDNICNYLDIPLQHADQELLKQMNRQGCAAEYLAMLTRIREALPDAVLRTTMIAGFPGETRAQAKASEDFLEQAGFNYVGVFPYSQEDGTPAGARPDQVPRRTRLARAQRLRDIADRIGMANAEALVGTTQEVLICGHDEEGPYGRTQGMAPDVDGLVHIQPAPGQPPKPGAIVQAQITESALYDLYAISYTN